MSYKQRVLFVDDEARVLRGLRRSLDCMRDEWQAVFAGSGLEALELMAQEPFDVVVSDMRMPGMSGVELLNEVRRLYPQTVRLALSGQSSKESVLKSVGPIHQYLPKPCDVETLQATLSRVWTLRDLLTVPRLKGLLAQLEQLPSLPSIYRTLMKELESSDGSLKEVGRIVEQDIGMSVKVLQLVNSAFFGIPQHISSPSQAVASLGMETVKSVALTVCVFSRFEDAAVNDLALDSLWEHSMAVGSFAKQISIAECADPTTTDHAFVAGLLHDVGKLVLASTLPGESVVAMNLAEEKAVALVDAERDVIGATHAQLGAYLLGLWGFSDHVLQAVAYHHDQTQSAAAGFGPSAAVHVANVLAHELCPTRAVGLQPSMDHAALDRLGLSGRVERWKEVCQETIPEGVT